MFYFQDKYICFSNGKSALISEWICLKSNEKSPSGVLAYNGLLSLFEQQKPPENTLDIKAVIDEGILKFKEDKEETMIDLVLSYIYMNKILIRRCENCGRFFTPLKRADEKYCMYPAKNGESPCRRSGAAKTFRKKHAEDPDYINFMQRTKHLRYLKNQKRLSEEEYAKMYHDEKIKLRNNAQNFKTQTTSVTADASSTPKTTIETYLL